MQRKVIGKLAKVIGDRVSMSALSEAKAWYEHLLDAEFRGRKDTDGAARYRLSRKLGVSETKLFRLQYRYEEMKDIAGETYRRLMLAYDDLCQRIEGSAEAMRQERMRLRAEYENANNPGHRDLAERTGVAADRPAAIQGENVGTTISGKPSGNLGAGRQ